MTEEAEKERLKEHSRVVIRMGDFQIELEGSHANVQSLMGKPLFDFIEKLQKVVGELPPTEAQVMPEEKAKEFPPPLGRPSSTIEALSTLFKTEWGRKPRALSEIMDALEANGLYYKKPVVAKVLVDLIKKKEIRRLGARGAFQYVAT